MSASRITYDYEEILTRLSAFFPVKDVKYFPLTYMKDKSKAMAAFYITNRAVQARLDATCIWRNSFIADPRDSLGKSILCVIDILIKNAEGESIWISRTDGAGNSDIEAIKGGLSDAMRRAAVQWGIGRYLYEVPGQWTEMKPTPVNSKGNPLYFKTTPRMPSKFLPDGENAQRAQSVSSEPEKPASATKADKKADKKSTKLTAAQTKKFAAAKDGKDLELVTAIFKTVTSGKVSVADGLAEITALPNVS